MAWLDTVLGYLLSFSNWIERVVQWGVENPSAGMFFGFLVVNLVYKFLPQGGFMRDIFDVVIDAGRRAYGRKFKG